MYPAVGYNWRGIGEYCSTRGFRCWLDSYLQEAHGHLEVPGITYAQEEQSK